MLTPFYIQCCTNFLHYRSIKISFLILSLINYNQSLPDEKIIFQGPPFDYLFPIFYALGFEDLKMPNLILKDVYYKNDEKTETIYEVDLSSGKGSRQNKYN